MNFDVGDAASDADEPTDEQDGDDVDGNATESEHPEAEPETETSSAGESEPTGQRSSREPAPTGEPKEPEAPEESETDPTETGPAFPYSEVKQSPLYAREETWHEFELWIDTELVPKLRREGIMDDELREIHDIILEIALDKPDEFVTRLKEKRRQS